MQPDFTGTWKLIRGESDFAFLGPPRLRVDTIVHHDPQLRISTRQKDAAGDITLERLFTVGGGPVEITIRGRPRQIRAFWQGAVLVLETASEVSGKLRQIEDRWMLAPDANWITIERTHQQPGGAVRQRLRMRRIEPRRPE